MRPFIPPLTQCSNLNDSLSAWLQSWMRSDYFRRQHLADAPMAQRSLPRDHLGDLTLGHGVLAPLPFSARRPRPTMRAWNDSLAT